MGAVEATDQYELGENSNLLAKVTENVKAAREVRRRFEPGWYIAREFYRGNQYAVFTPDRGLVANPLPGAAESKKPRLVVNEARVNIDTILAYLLKNEPVFTVAAQTGEPEDQAAATLGKQVLYHFWYAMKCGRRLRKTGTWALNTGKCYWKIGWDPNAGPLVPIHKMVEIPAAPQSMEDLLAGLPPPEPQLQDAVVGERPGGDVAIDLVSCFELFVDPAASELEDAQWVAYESMRPLEAMRAAYPKFAAQIQADDGSRGGTSGYASSVLQAFGAGGAKQAGRDRLGRVCVLEFWQRKTAEHPNGLRVVCTKNLCLDAGPTPPGYEEIPFGEWSDGDVPGEYYSDGTMRDQIPLQKEFNRRGSQLIDIANKFKTKFFATEGSILEESMNDEDGEFVFHHPGQRPEAVAPPPPPEVLLKLLEFTREGMRNVSGAVSVLHGETDGETRSGRQVAYMGQYGETRISLRAKALAEFLETVGRMILLQVAANVSEERIAKMVGKNRKVEIRWYKGADLRGNTDVSVQAGSLLGFTRTERFGMLKDMLKDKVIGPDEFREALEMEDYQGLLEDIAQDRNNALLENDGWRTGKIGEEPYYFDDHKIHLHSHNQFRKSGAYRAMTPEQRFGIDAHCKVHEQFLVPPPEAGGPPPPGGDGGAPPKPGDLGGAPAGVAPPPSLGADPNDLALAQSGQEIAAGLPPLPAVADIGPENQH